MVRSSGGGAVCAVAVVVLALLGARAELRHRLNSRQAIPQPVFWEQPAHSTFAGDISAGVLANGVIWSDAIWPDAGAAWQTGPQSVDLRDAVHVWLPATPPGVVVSFGVLSSSGQIALLHTHSSMDGAEAAFLELLANSELPRHEPATTEFVPIFAKKQGE